MPIQTIRVENPQSHNVIMGCSELDNIIHEIHKALIAKLPNIRFGLAFCEDRASLSRKSAGTDATLIELAEMNVRNIGADKTFVLFITNAFPKKVLQALRDVEAIQKIYCATSQPVEVIIMDKGDARGVMGLVNDCSTSAMLN